MIYLYVEKPYSDTQSLSLVKNMGNGSGYLETYLDCSQHRKLQVNISIEHLGKRIKLIKQEI